METATIQVLFFDLGDTLVEADRSSPGELRFRWLPGARETLVELAAAGLRLGLISNTGSFGRDDLLAMLPADFEWSLFDAPLVVLSSEVGLEKPDLRIFRLALQRAQEHDDPEQTLGIDPPDCLFCGEALGETLAAQRVGMRAARVLAGAESEIGGLGDRLRQAGWIP